MMATVTLGDDEVISQTQFQEINIDSLYRLLHPSLLTPPLPSQCIFHKNMMKTRKSKPANSRMKSQFQILYATRICFLAKIFFLLKLTVPQMKTVRFYTYNFVWLYVPTPTEL